jgi:hypothetical protein
MLSRTGSIPDENRLLKRAKSRAEPYDYIDAELNSRIAQQEPEDDAETKEVKLNEEISLSKYDPEVKKVILTGMVKALNDVYVAYWADDDEYENSKKEYNKGNTEKFYKLMEVDLLNFVSYEVNDALFALGHRIEPALQEVEPKLLKDNIGGYAQGYEIVMNRKVMVEITSLICKVIRNKVEKKYVIGELLKGLYSVVEEMIENGGVDLLEFSDLKKAINEYAGTFIHELVHIIQHARQKHRGGKFEFRSHLDKEKNEFAKLARKNSVFPSDDSASSSPKLSSEEQARYYNLYFASTAEIAAHAHNIALGIIRRYSLEQPRPTKSMYINQGNYALKDITRLIDGYLDKRYKGKTDPKVQAVYKRYHKLVYQEVYKFIQDTLDTANFKA